MAARQWHGRAQWRELHAGFAGVAPLLSLWRDWRADPRRPALLHVVALVAEPPQAAALLRDAAAHGAGLPALAGELAMHWWGLTPGLHRISLDAGRVRLTLAVGDAQRLVRELDFTADAVHLGPMPDAAPRTAVLHGAVRLCRRGSTLALHGAEWQADALRPLGLAGITSTPEGLHARFEPAWTPRRPRADAPPGPQACVVVGGGLAGAAAAASLASRGWQVRVLDAAPAPASGASGLPAGLLVPHLSPDDNILSRLSRCGLRITRQAAQALLAEGADWDGRGTLEHRLRGAAALRAGPFGADWSRPASGAECAAAGLPPGAAAVWHARAGWYKPAALVRAWLAQPGVAWCGGAAVAAVEPLPAGGWTVRGAGGQVLAQAPLVVLAAALGNAPLAGGALALHPVRGQVSWGLRTPGQRLPPGPVNGQGHLLPAVPTADGAAWMIGATYGRADTDLDARAADHAANLARLRLLLPDAAAALAPAFDAAAVRAWTGVRCASTDRRPLVGELAPGLWTSTAMGSRGLTFAALCAELLAARLHHEPLPLPLPLAAALDVRRHIRQSPQGGREPA